MVTFVQTDSVISESRLWQKTRDETLYLKRLAEGQSLANYNPSFPPPSPPLAHSFLRPLSKTTLT